MAGYTLPYFGNLPIGNLEEYYEVDIELNGNNIQIDLNFEHEIVDTLILNKVKNFITNLGEFDKLNELYILNGYNDDDGDTVKFYLEHHLEEVDKEELTKLVNFDETIIEPELQLLSKLKLVRVGLYPDNENNFATFDYSIGKDITDQLVVVNTDENGQLEYITMES